LKKIILILIVLFTPNLPVFTDAVVQPEKEAPKVLFKTDITGADVDFYMSGSWTSSLFMGSGVLFQSGYLPRMLDYFPGSDTGFIFENIPDLTFSVYLMKKYFLELSVLSDFEKNSFLMGYKDEDNNFLNYLYIGNRDIRSDPYPFIEIPDAGNSSLGIEAGLHSGNTAEHHLMLRYDSNGTGIKYFLGMNEVQEETIDVKDYIRGKYFFIPDTDVEDFTLYLSDPGGSYTGSDGFRYRKAGPDDYILNNHAGTLSLKKDFKGKAAVYYTKNGYPVGDAAIGRGGLPGVNGNEPDAGYPPVDFNWNLSGYPGGNMASRKVTINSENSLLLWDNGNFTPFLDCSNYKVTEGLPENSENARVRLVKRDNRYEKAEVSASIRFSLNAPDSTITAHRTDKNTAAGRDFYAFFPFPDPGYNIYTPKSIPDSDKPEYQILVMVLQPVTEYILEDNIIPGSVHVLKNGMEETRFKVDYDSGKINFTTEIFPDDFMEIRYSKAGISEKGGDLIFDWGNTIKLSESILLRFATGFRWNILSGTYTESEFAKTGSMLVSAGLSEKKKNYDFNLSLGAGYSVPDTTGIFRIEGMEGTGTDVEIDENNIYPSSVPSDISGLSRTNRGKILYKDYRSYGSFGSVTLHYYEDPIPADQEYAYTSGSKPGPYIVGGSSAGKSGKSMAIDFDMDTLKEWVGAQIPMGGGNPPDLSSARSVSLSFKVFKLSGNVRMYLEIGETGEDLDGDGILDREQMESSKGFEFNDISNNAVLYVGGGPRMEGNGKIDSEDLNNNGFLDPDNPAHIVSVTSGGSADILLLDSPADQWIKFTHNFSEAEREKLKNAGSVRIVVVKQSGDTADGVILIDKITFNGSPFWQKADSPGEVTAQEIDENYSAYLPSADLEDSFTEVKSIFHPHGERQKILQITWNSVPAGGSWTVGKYLNNVINKVMYSRLVFYLRAASMDNSQDAVLSIGVVDTGGRGITIGFKGNILAPGIDSPWKKVEVDLGDGTVLINGQKTESTVTVDRTYNSLTELKISCTNSSSGALYLDEFSFRESKGSFGAALKADMNYRIPGKILSAGGVDILSNIILKERLYSATPGFSPVYGIPEDAFKLYSFSEVSFSVNALSVYFSILFDGSGSSDWRELSYSIAGSHKLTLPVQFLYTTVTDSFSKKTGEQGISIYKEDSVITSLPGLAALKAGINDNVYAGLLDQKWYGGMNFNLLNPFTLSADIEIEKSFAGYSAEDNDYFSAWTKSFTYIVPYISDQETNRNVSLNNRMGLATEPAGINITADISSECSNLLTMDRTQENTVHLMLEIPLKIFPDSSTPVSIIPGYSRELKLTSGKQAAGNLSADLEKIKSDIMLNSYVITGIPFLEITGPDLKNLFSSLTASYEKASYMPGFSVNFSRNYSSRIIDLILPSMLNVYGGRKLVRNFDTMQDMYLLSLNLKSTAINLFGKLGAYPFFSFYNSDEFGSSLFLDMDLNDNYSIKTYSLAIGHYMSLYGKDKNLLTLKNRFKVEDQAEKRYADSADISFTWNVKPEEGIELPYVPNKFLKESFIRNIEELTFNTDGSHPVTLIASHESSFVMPDYGHVKFNTGIGFDYEYSDSSAIARRAFRIFIKGGIEVKISF